MQIQMIVRNRARHLLRRFNEDQMPPVMAAPSLTDQGLQSVRDYAGGKVGPLAGHDPKQVAVWRFGDPDRSSVWVAPGYAKYAEAWQDFIAEVYGVPRPTVPAGMDIDHIQNRARAPAHFMVRVEAVDASVNRSHGAGFEKRYGRSPVTEARMAAGTKPALMTFVAALKLAGVASPLMGASRNAEARQAEIVAFFTSHGWAKATVEQALASLAEVADR